MTGSSEAAERWRVHWVIAELDVRGEIDAHAAMCLRQAIGEVRAGATELVLVDLRDLSAIDSAGLALLTIHDAECHAHGMQLGLLIGGRTGHDQIAETFVLAGLGRALRYGAEHRLAPAVHPVGLLARSRGVRRGPLGSAARRVSRRWPRRARAT